MTWLIVLVLLGLWIGVGAGLLHWFARPGSGELRRIVSNSVCGIRDQLTVTLRAVPPINPAAVSPYDVVLLLDRSSSMGAAPGSPFREMLRAAEAFARRLPEQVHVAVVAFDHTAECVCPFAADKRRVVRGISTIAPGGGTSIGNALNTSAEVLNSSRPNIARMVVLFSDGFDSSEEVRAAVEALRSHTTKPVIYCASFGDSGSLPLMTAIAGTTDRVFHTENFTGIVSLFDSLAAEVSGQRAIGGLLYEQMRAPCPFRLLNTGGSTPVDVHVEQSTHVVWPLPQFDNEVTPISYVLEPFCVGWHKVVIAPGSVTWRLPNGSIVTREGNSVTRVLVLPAWATWAWPIANPCLMLLLAPLLRCRPEASQAAAESVPVLPTVPIPPSLPAPAEPAFRPVVRPAIVVGLGRAGTNVLSVFSNYLQDRAIDPARVSLLAVQVGAADTPTGSDPADRQTFRQEHTASIDADFWPYLDAQRDRTLPEGRTWLPVAKWLGGTTPLTTLRGAPLDRGMVRLCALLRPDTLHSAVTAMLASHVGEDTKAILIGAVEDVETTGLLAELAHLFAVHGKASTCVLLAAQPGSRGEAGIAAFGDEMTRLLTRRGEAVTSDRGGVTEAARQLFDRVLVLDHQTLEPAARSRAAATATWLLLAQRAIDDRMPPLRGDAVYRVRLSARLAPQHRLWTWVRERALNDAIVRRWLAHDEPASGKPSVERANEEVTRQFVASFWSGQILNRQAPALLAHLEKISAGQATGFSLVDAGRDYPFNRPYHEQKSFCDRERNAFGFYLEAWCVHVFDESAAKQLWGLPEALAAATAIQAELSGVQAKLRPYAQDANAANLVSFTLALVLELRALVSRFVDGVEAWHNVFVSSATRPASSVGGMSVERSIQTLLRDAEARLGDWPSLKTRVEPQYENWLSRQLPNLLTNLRFRAHYDPDRGNMAVELVLFDKVLTAENDIAGALRAILQPFSNEVLDWPVGGWLLEQRVTLPGGQWMAVGRNADRVFGAAIESIDASDPAVAVAVTAETVSIRDALDCQVEAHADDYVWAEEANAERMRGLIRGLLHRDPPKFSPLATSLLRRPSAVLEFLLEVASGQVGFAGTSVVLQRGSERFVLARLAGNTATVEDFESAAERAVLEGVDLENRPLPVAADSMPRSGMWRDELDRFVSALDASPTGKAVAEHPQWAMWRDVARGVFLQQVIR